MIDMPIIVAAFIISLVLRVSQGSTTGVILTTGGLLSEAVTGLSGTQLVLVTLASCFGGLDLSHVNDSGFWIVTRYLGLSVSDGLKTWIVLTALPGFLFYRVNLDDGVIIQAQSFFLIKEAFFFFSLKRVMM